MVLAMCKWLNHIWQGTQADYNLLLYQLFSISNFVNKAPGVQVHSWSNLLDGAKAMTAASNMHTDK
jgi:hypothetical protein